MLNRSQLLEKNIFEAVGKQTIFSAGSYLVALERLKEGLGRSWDNQPAKPTISFIFRPINSPHTSQTVTRTVPVSQREGSTCISFIRQLSGIHQPSLETLRDGQALIAHINSLVGKKFIAQIEPSKDGRFNNIVGITVCPEDSRLLASGE